MEARAHAHAHARALQAQAAYRYAQVTMDNEHMQVPAPPKSNESTELQAIILARNDMCFVASMSMPETCFVCVPGLQLESSTAL